MPYKDKTRRAEYMREYAECNRDRVNGHKRAYKERHPHSDHEYYEDNKEVIIARSLAWSINNRDRKRVINENRRAGEMKAEGFYTKDNVNHLYNAQSGRCTGCGTSLLSGYDVDHMLPLSRGGSNWPTNLQLMCHSCNRSKHNKTMEEWLAIMAAREKRSKLT